LNFLNARSNENHKEHKNIIGIENIITELVEKNNGNKERKFIVPIKNFRQIAKSQLEEVLISHKAKNKVVTKNKNKIKGSDNHQETLTPRGQLHKETVYGSAKFLQTKAEKITAKFDEFTINKVQNPTYKKLLFARLKEFDNDPKKAFSGKNAIDKNPIYIDENKSIKLPEKVVLAWYEIGYTIRKPINPDNFKDLKSLEKITDIGVKNVLIKRLNDFNGNAKEAFSDLEKNPIWLNKEKGVAIKIVTITGINNAEALHYKKDHFGNEILDESENKIPVDFVSTGNNHHVAIYEDADGNLQEKVVSFYEAVERVNQHLLVIDKEYNSSLGWKFIFTMKQNEMFLFPSEEFNPNEIDLLDEKNLKIISKKMFRVQKISTKNYFFRHHLETNVDDSTTLKGISWRREGLNGIRNIIKVRLNHLGKIVHIGEY